MQKTRVGLSVGVFGALICLVGLFAGFVPVLMLTGYVLLFEDNGWLNRCAVKVLLLMVCFSFANSVVGLVPDFLGVLGNLAVTFEWSLQLNAVNSFFGATQRLISVTQKILFLVLGCKALKQKTIVIPALDCFISDHMG